MRRILLGLALAGLTSLPGLAEEPRNAAIEGVIQDQITAFETDDFAKAFSYASPTIQGIFGTADNFGAMVRNGYPMVWRPGSVKFTELREVAGGLYQTVVIADQAGAVHVLEYEMIPVDGGWVIGGVQLLRAPDVGA